VKVKLDENLGRRALKQFQAAGHDVTSVPGQRLCSAPDHALISICGAEGRCLVSLDLDFANPLVFKPDQYAGIAVLRLPAKPTPDDLDAAVATLLAEMGKRTIHGKLWIVAPGRIRQYHRED
jgi:predicted nuclease of predicted toxin-antitoxin system